MGLPRAIQAHGEGNLALAEAHYKRALVQKQYKPALFQNYGSLLKANGDLIRSKEIYIQGLEIYPDHVGILRNYSNFLRADGKSSEALRYALKALRSSLKDKSSSSEGMYCECVDLLRENNLLQWAYYLLLQAFADFGIKTQLLWRLFCLSNHQGSDSFDSRQSELVLSLIEERLNQLNPIEQAEFLFLKSFYYVKRKELSLAVESVNEAQQILGCANFADQEECDKAQKLIELNSWNVSCLLLKACRFDEAWKLFEYGLRAPAAGRQRWQRHLHKLFTYKELPLWRGSHLKSKRLLLLEEQAIGDTMMFLTLLPALVEEAGHVGIVLSARLRPIYKRSCSHWIRAQRVSIWSHDDVPNGRLLAKDFDCQSPVGSVCQYRFTRIELYAPKVPILAADLARTSWFKTQSPCAFPQSRRIGISWRGGGRSDRIKLKSIDADMIAALMREHSEGVSYVNLQYGDVSPVVEAWQAQGLPVVNETDVNPLKNMEEWLNLVASCDAVISVANTTIHGAGGLNIPTLCLLSQHSDWRWLNDAQAKRSYWYPSVGIARECTNDGWSPAFEQVNQWIGQGCPMPDGPVYTEVTEGIGARASVGSLGIGA